MPWTSLTLLSSLFFYIYLIFWFIVNFRFYWLLFEHGDILVYYIYGLYFMYPFLHYFLIFLLSFLYFITFTFTYCPSTWSMSSPLTFGVGLNGTCGMLAAVIVCTYYFFVFFWPFSTKHIVRYGLGDSVSVSVLVFTRREFYVGAKEYGKTASTILIIYNFLSFLFLPVCVVSNWRFVNGFIFYTAFFFLIMSSDLEEDDFLHRSS